MSSLVGKFSFVFAFIINSETFLLNTISVFVGSGIIFKTLNILLVWLTILHLEFVKKWDFYH